MASDSERPKSVLSETAGCSDRGEDHRHTSAADRHSEYSLKRGPEHDDEHLLCLHDDGDLDNPIALSTNHPTTWQRSNPAALEHPSQLHRQLTHLTSSAFHPPYLSLLTSLPLL